MWLRDFQEQWLAFASDLSELPDVPSRAELPEAGQVEGVLSGPEAGRARGLRILLAAHRLAAGLSGATPKPEMPGLDETEREENLRFQPGVPVHIGKMNRVKCHAHGPSPGLEKDALYLLPSQCTLLLVRPDDQRPFWAIPVITEPLRLIRLASGDENAGQELAQLSSGDPQKTLRLEVSSPRSPSLRSSPGHLPISGYADYLAHSLPTPAAPAHDFMTLSMMASLPVVPSFNPPLETKVESTLPLSLSFSDERRRRVAWKVVAQAQHQVCQRLSEGVTDFLRDIKQGNLPM